MDIIRKNLRTMNEDQKDSILEYINLAENIEKALFKIDINKTNSSLFTIGNTEKKAYNPFEDYLKKINNDKNSKSYLDTIQILDNNFSLLMISSLAGGFMGVFIVACISIKHEDNGNTNLYFKE